MGRERSFCSVSEIFRLSGIGIPIYCGLCSCDCCRFRSFCFCIFYGSIDSFFSKKYRIISVLVFYGDVFYAYNLYHFFYRRSCFWWSIWASWAHFILVFIPESDCHNKSTVLLWYVKNYIYREPMQRWRLKGYSKSDGRNTI